MKGSMIGMVAGGCRVVGFGVGCALRPVIAPAGASAAAVAGVAQPTEEEAIAAVRRHRLFSGTSLANATLKLGDCSPGGVGPGVTCMTQLTMDATKANATPQNRPVRSEEHTSELQSLMRISYAVLCLKKQKKTNTKQNNNQ